MICRRSPIAGRVGTASKTTGRRRLSRGLSQAPWRIGSSPITQDPRRALRGHPPVDAGAVAWHQHADMSTSEQILLPSNSILRVCDALDDTIERFLQEKARLAEHIRPGFERRIVSLAAPAPIHAERKHAVSWSNHLKPEATQIIKEMEREAREGAPPTARLDAEWRQRMEDLVWALINSPEFVMMP